MGGHRIRTLGLKRVRVKVGLLNLAYNMKRLVQLTANEARRQARRAASPEGIGLPVAA